jgi:hypothetical protein
MAQHKDPQVTPSFDDLIDDIMYGTHEEDGLTYEVLLQWSERYPQHWRELAEYFASWASSETYAALPPDEDEDESRFDWLAVPSTAYFQYILRCRSAGISEDTILPLSPFEQSVLSAIGMLQSPRFNHFENIVATVRKLSGSDVSENSILEALRSLESRNGVYSYSPDVKKYADVGGKE